MNSNKHIVLVHGACHGAWCWYRLVNHLRSSSAGSRVTALDLGGCGTDPRQLDEVRSVSEYVQPLMDLLKSLPGDEKVVLVGHSYGGLPIALAMERFPEKVSVAVFLSAYMPSCSSPPGLVIQEYFTRNSASSFLDSKFDLDDGMQNPPTSAIFGPGYMTKKLYAGCPPEDLELAKMLIRPTRLFTEEMMAYGLTEERYGSVKRVFVMCEEDEVIFVDFQRFMIQNSPPDEVKTMKGAHHMVMLSKPRELCRCLGEIAAKYR
ncbi:methylesterase 10 [Punica granatum]|uniref:Methylesterase 10 n=1 Tax=Punica granatum TaxID=22663 RepID=A0A6P8D430_PUNGR|nr:methylesterase 10 [Punica granatum]